MRFLRWPLLFCLVYGILWIRAELRAPAKNSVHEEDAGPLPDIGKPDEPVMRRILTEDPRSKASLSYAFSKMSPGSRKTASIETRSDESDFEEALAHVQSLRDNPQALLTATQQELRNLDAAHVVERSILLREAYVAFDHDLSPEMSVLLDQEREWMSQNVADIPDETTRKGYVQEITRFSTQNAANSAQRREMLKGMVSKLATHPEALRAFRAAVLEYAEWDLPELVETAPPEAQSVLRGHTP
ncbi:MAG: hypothetical protein ABIR96_12660 [Bdellovibrionota bacterium]